MVPVFMLPLLQIAVLWLQSEFASSIGSAVSQGRFVIDQPLGPALHVYKAWHVGRWEAMAGLGRGEKGRVALSLAPAASEKW